MWKHNCAFERLLESGLALLRFFRQSDEMCDELGHLWRILATHSMDTANDGLFVTFWYIIGAAEDDIGEEVLSVRTELTGI